MQAVFARFAWLLLVSAALAGCDKPQATTVPAPAPVSFVAAIEGPAAAQIRTNGMVLNKDEMRLSFKMGGILKHIAVREGEHVKRGVVLAEIELTEVNAQLEQARQGAAKSTRDVERAERLYKDQVMTLEQLQDLRTQAAMARAALASAQFNSGYSVIKAPSDGVVLRTIGEQREMVAAGAPVIIFGARASGFIVKLGLADREVVQMRVGDQARITLDAYPGAVFAGSVSEIASGADERTGTFPTEVKLEPTDQPLVSGLVAKVSITPFSATQGMLVRVPVKAIVEGSGRNATVFVLEDNKAHKRAVEVAFIEDDQVALLNGVKAGESVITDGALYVDDGEHVAVARVN